MKTIFITGANRGIGKELARQLLIKGNIVIASCRNPENAESLRALHSEFNYLDIVELSVDDENSVLSCFNKLKSENRKIDLLLNNAGIIDWEDMNRVTLDSLEKFIARISSGPLWSCGRPFPAFANLQTHSLSTLQGWAPSAFGETLSLGSHCLSMLKSRPQYADETSGHRLVVRRDPGHFN